MHRSPDRMPCHISDGPQTPEDMYEPEEVDADEAYDMYRQQCVDDGECLTMGCSKPHLPDSIHCEDCQ